MRYEPLAINFHLGETPPREPQERGEVSARQAELNEQSVDKGIASRSLEWEYINVSHSAAEKLGMVGTGLAKVKIDVVQ